MAGKKDSLWDREALALLRALTSLRTTREARRFIRDLMSRMYSSKAADAMIIQYGGSVKPNNAAELMGMEPPGSVGALEQAVAAAVMANVSGPDAPLAPGPAVQTQSYRSKDGRVSVERVVSALAGCPGTTEYSVPRLALRKAADCETGDSAGARGARAETGWMSGSGEIRLFSYRTRSLSLTAI